MASIRMRVAGFNSYSPSIPVSVFFDKPVSILYGTNGSGKSSLVELLRRHVRGVPLPAGCTVELDGVEDPELFIYDETYIEDNFRRDPTFAGVFTLGEDSKEKEDEILRQLTLASDHDRRCDEIQSEADRLKAELETSKSAAALSMWKAIVDAHRGQPLDFCLEGYKGSKSKLFDHLMSLETLDGSVDLADLVREAIEISDDTPTPRKIASLNLLGFDEIEQDELLTKLYFPSGDSRLSGLVSKLSNIEWVRQGRAYEEDAGGVCPYCQQTLPHDHADALRRLFDRAYEEACAHLRSQCNTYTTLIESLELALKDDAFKDEYYAGSQLWAHVSSFLEVARANAATLAGKASAPGDPAELVGTATLRRNVQTVVEVVSARQREFNQRLQDIPGVRRDITRRFWARARFDVDSIVAGHLSHRERLESRLAQLREEFRSARHAAAAARTVASDLQASRSSIDAAVARINDRLKGIGLRGFSIQASPDVPGHYHIVRGNAPSQYRSLSEGEKTLLTFLYFIESTLGTLTPGAAPELKKRYLVIDDPISSLSQNHVYDVASLIHHLYAKTDRFAQLVVLTHNLFFYHELVHLVPRPGRQETLAKSYRFLRCTRLAEGSVVEVVEHDFVKNDYQACWDIVKRSRGGAFDVSLPMAMRSILEHFFSFVGERQKVYKLLEELEEIDHEFQGLYRYINREAHADATNLSDFKDHDPSHYIERFERIFDRMQFRRHFDQMMGIEPVTADVVA
ncbi:MAG TPA: AAA family ATPase [Lysobacter sp.]|nr:AAA family ATPase [Lysobacter sp.]